MTTPTAAAQATESPFDRYERRAAQFFKDTGLMAPGKDMPAELYVSEEEALRRTSAWIQWLKANPEGEVRPVDPSRLAWVPVWRLKDGNEVVLLGKDYCGTTLEEARQIRLGMGMVEAILLGLTFHSIRCMDMEYTPHIGARLGLYQVIIVGGPTFEARKHG